MCEMVEKFWASNTLLNGSNVALVALIPKIDNRRDLMTFDQ